MPSTRTLANSLTIILGALYSSYLFACEYQLPWEKEDSRDMLKNMYELADYEANTKEPEAFEAAVVFLKIVNDEFDEWRVDSDDSCDCVILDPKGGKKEKRLRKL